MVESSFRHLKSRTEQGVLVLTIAEAQLHGDALADSLKQELRAAVAQHQAQNVVLDFQHVQSLSSETFRPLLSLRRHLQEARGRMVLCNLSPPVAKAFQVTRLVSTSRASGTTFETQADVAAAIASLKTEAPHR